MNAVERFLAAFRARNVDAASAELAPDVVMLNPATDEPVVGNEAVAAALRAVEETCDEFQHTHLLADTYAVGRASRVRRRPGRKPGSHPRTAQQLGPKLVAGLTRAAQPIASREHPTRPRCVSSPVES